MKLMKVKRTKSPAQKSQSLFFAWSSLCKIMFCSFNFISPYCANTESSLAQLSAQDYWHIWRFSIVIFFTWKMLNVLLKWMIIELFFSEQNFWKCLPGTWSWPGMCRNLENRTWSLLISAKETWNRIPSKVRSNSLISLLDHVLNSRAVSTACLQLSQVMTWFLYLVNFTQKSLKNQPTPYL